MFSSWMRNTLPSGAISVMKLFDVSRQLPENDGGPMRQTTLSRRPHGNLASCQKTAVSFPSGAHDCPRIFDVVESTGRLCLEEEQQRMSRDSEEIEGVTLPPVYNDPVLKGNQKHYHSFVRDVNLSPMEHVGVFFFLCLVRTPIFCLLLVSDCCPLRDSDELKSPCPKVFMWNLRGKLGH